MNDSSPKCYAIIPAAGRSQRMGSHKLLLPWPQSPGLSTVQTRNTVMDAVLRAWTESRVDVVVIVLRQLEPNSTAQNRENLKLQEVCRNYPVEIAYAAEPPDMKASVLSGIQFLRSNWSPREWDECLLAPADLPTLSGKLINLLLDCKARSPQIVQPVFGNHRGHPVKFPWSKLTQAFDLGSDQGIDSIIKNNPTFKLILPENLRVTDIDDLHDYQNLLQRHLQDIPGPSPLNDKGQS